MVPQLPEVVLKALLPQVKAPTLVSVQEVELTDSTGAATAGVVKLAVEVDAVEGPTTTHQLVCKTFQPLVGGPHAAGTHDPRHWAYWRREPLFYASDVAPRGPHLSAPRCFAALDHVVYLEDVTGQREDPERAAYNLGRWQTSAHFPELPWLTRNQLADRIEARDDLVWTRLAADPRLAEVWGARLRLLRLLDDLPKLPSHGDYSIGNLRSAGGVTVALDWATVGHAVVGADCASLAMSVEADVLSAYLNGLGGHVSVGLARTGYDITYALTGVSRAHWMMTRKLPVPVSHVDRIWDAFSRVSSR